MPTFILRRSIATTTLIAATALPAAAQQIAPGERIVPQAVDNGAQPLQQLQNPAARPQNQLPGQVPVQGQQPAQGQPLAQPQVPVQPPAGFQLNAIEQGMLDQVLNAWQQQSAKIERFRCDFERWEYNAFGPKIKNEDAPLNKCTGELSYNKPDQGSFQIKEIRTFKTEPQAPNQDPNAPVKGDWILQPEALGEHWVCDGKSIFEYRHQQKQLVERPLPPQMQGRAIVDDGPLPFLFGAEAEKLKSKYWMRIEEQPNQAEIWLTALPRFQAQAADYKRIEVILDRTHLLPKAMRVTMPDNSLHVYMFDIKNAAINRGFAILQGWFSKPKVWPGYKHIVEQPPAPQQAANPAPPEQQAR